MIYFETNVTTTDTPTMYTNNAGSERSGNTKNGEGQQQYPDYSYQMNNGHYQQQMPQQGSPVIHSRSQGGDNWSQEPNSKFSTQDIQILKQLLATGEKYKWKEITKEINKRSYERRKGTDGQSGVKNVSPTFVTKQYQSMLGLPNNNMYFGTVGSSLPYIVAENGWDDIEELESELGRSID